MINNCPIIYMDNVEMKNYVGEVFFGIRELNSTEREIIYQTGTNNCTRLPFFPPGSDDPNDTSFPSGNFSVRFFSSACWSYTPGTKDWTTDGCRVGICLKRNRYLCCVVLQVFMTDKNIKLIVKEHRCMLIVIEK